MANPLVVVATDLSPESERAFATGAMLARATGAEIRLVHTVRAVPGAARVLHAPPLREPSVDAELSHARGRLEQLAKAFPGDLTVSTDICVGEDHDVALANYAAQHAAQFLVIASHGRSGVRRLVLGSVAEGVLRQSKVPVVVVPIGDN